MVDSFWLKNKILSIGLIRLSVRNFLQSPMQGIRIKNQPEKKVFTGNRKNMIKRSALAVGVVKPDFNNRVLSAFPNKPLGNNPSCRMVEKQSH